MKGIFGSVKDKDLLIIQPVLTNYRKFFFDGLSRCFKLVEVYADLNPGEGFKSSVTGEFKKIHTPIIGRQNKLYYQKGIILSVLKNRPSAIFITADFRAIHYWIILVISSLLGIPVFSHGQGLYNKPRPSSIQKLMFRMAIFFSSKYVCYTETVRKSLMQAGIKSSDLSVMHNTVINACVVKPDEKVNTKPRILYVGRLRNGSNLEVLFDAMKLLKESGNEIGLDIIGDGTERCRLQELTSCFGIDVNFFGAVYDDRVIADLSRSSTIGVYPGDAGLSLVHYMSLSLVPIVHDDLTRHMGPEPSYIKSGVNGLTFKRGDSMSLANTIEYALESKNTIRLSIAAYKTYCSLSKPSMADKLIKIMRSYLKD